MVDGRRSINKLFFVFLYKWDWLVDDLGSPNSCPKQCGRDSVADSLPWNLFSLMTDAMTRATYSFPRMNDRISQEMCPAMGVLFIKAFVWVLPKFSLYLMKTVDTGVLVACTSQDVPPSLRVYIP